MTHKCIKPSCGKSYASDEPDAYYCPSCFEQKKKIAEEIDAKIKPSTSTQMSGLAQYDSLPKVHGFVRASDLGL